MGTAFLPVLRPLLVGTAALLLSSLSSLSSCSLPSRLVSRASGSGSDAAEQGADLQTDGDLAILTPANVPSDTPPDPITTPGSSSPEELVASMTLSQRAAACIVVAGDGGSVLSDPTLLSEEDAERISDACWGGVILSSPNIQDPEQLTSLISALQDAASSSAAGPAAPMLVAVDEEGGLVTRVSGKDGFNVPAERSAAELGETGSPEEAYGTGARIGGYLAGLGFNVDFAPVVDVRTDACDEVMASRCLSDDPQEVMVLASAEEAGFADAGVATAAKHFPGLGSAYGDSHDESVTVHKTLDELLASDLVPYERLAAEEVPMVMVGHVLTPEATSDGLPASLSAEMMGDVLRGRLGYGGVVVTDALNMRAATNAYPEDELAWRAIAAGADVALMPTDPEASVREIVAAVERGDLPEERLDEAATRMMSLRMSLAR